MIGTCNRRVVLCLGPVVALLLALPVTTPVLAGNPTIEADFWSIIDSPERTGGGMAMFDFSMKTGLTARFVLGVSNAGGTAQPLEFYVIFTGAVDVAGQIDAPGFDCEVRHDAGINAAIRCTSPSVAADGEAHAVRFQARGIAAGNGKIGAVLNPSRASPESEYDNNNFTVNVSVE